MSRLYSLNKCHRILLSSYKFLKSKTLTKNPDQKQKLLHILEKLEEAIFQQDSETATTLAHEAQDFQKSFPLSLPSRIYETVKAICFAAAVAFFVRQFWFELYEVPTGSMRPTILEQDRMLVSKTTFGFRVPFLKKNIAFYPDSITRGGLVVFTVGDLPIADANTTYFGLIPGKKRYIKRCLGRPGDRLYFYGGKLYGIDEKDQPIVFPDSLEKLYHVPLISFDGTITMSSSGMSSNIFFNQFHQPFGKASFPRQSLYGQFFAEKSWKNDQPNLLKYDRDTPVSYADLFGMGNYAMVRILTHQQAALTHVIQDHTSPMYLEIAHTANVSYPAPLPYHRAHPCIQPMKTLLPLREEHIHLIRNNLTTSRFVVSGGRAYKYHPFEQSTSDLLFAIPLEHVPDGCYEYLKGNAYKINSLGMRTKLKPPHPLTQLNDAQVVLLFNCGIQFHSLYIPSSPQHTPFPNRYAFYNQGNLYIMDAPVFIKNDPALQKFVQSEKAKQDASSEDKPYIAFIDKGLPPKEPEKFITFMHKFGLKIPEGHILVLGDNYPMSADSREFGFVPVENLLGSPVWVFWPIGHFGKLNSEPAPITLPGYLMNGSALAIVLFIIGYRQYRRRSRLFPPID